MTEHMSLAHLKKNEKASGYFGQTEFYRKVYIDPYTGIILKNENSKYEFFMLTLMLHRNLLLGKDIGQPIVAWSVVIFVLMLLTGIYLWWPKKWAIKSIKNSFLLKWKSSPKRINFDLHNVLGFYASILLLVISLSGLFFAFKWFRNSVQWVANGGKIVIVKKSDINSVKPDRIDTINALDHIASNNLLQEDGEREFSITFPNKKRPYYSASSNLSKNAHYERIKREYNQYTGEVIRESNFEDLDSNGEKLYSLNYDLHVGSILGLTGKIIAFFASLIAASLPVTGFFIWFLKGRKQKIVKIRSKSPVTDKTKSKLLVKL
jgi:uncharacterized iron-regulated membrane protein